MTHAPYEKSRRQSSWLLAMAVAMVAFAALAGTGLLNGQDARAAGTVVVSANTSPAENQPGWMFNRDPGNTTPYAFNNAAASIGAGSLNVLPIGATAADKFIGEFFMLSPLANVQSISYDFKIGSGGTAGSAGQFYMNVYANFGASSPTKFYDCRYNVVPATGSTTLFTTVTFNPSATYPVTTSGSSPSSCPATPAAMGAGATLRMFSLNVGDTSASDSGLDGYLDNVVVTLAADTTTYDFDPKPQCTLVCYANAATGNDANGGTSPVDAKKTIQAAVNQVSAGGEVRAAAGTYRENITIPKPLTLKGAGNSTRIIPALSAPATCVGNSLCPGSSNIILVQANNVTIQKVLLDGDNPALTSGIVRMGADLDARNGIITNHPTSGIPGSGVFQNLTVDHVTVKNIYLRGMYASSGGSFNFHHNIVTNIQGSPSSIAIFNFGGAGVMAHNTVSWANDGIASNWSTGVQFLNNRVTNAGSGIHTDNSGGYLTGGADLIQGNSVTKCTPDGYGIWVFVPYNAPTVRNNTVTGCQVGLGAFGGSFSPGLTVTTLFINNLVDGGGSAASIGALIQTDTFGYGDTDVKASFTNNSIRNFAFGLQVTQTGGKSATVTVDKGLVAKNGVGLDNLGATLTVTRSCVEKNATGFASRDQGAAVATTVAHQNSITKNTLFGANNTGATVMNAELNWWDSPSGPSLAGVNKINSAAAVDGMPFLTSETNTCQFDDNNVGAAEDDHDHHDDDDEHHD